MTCYHPLIRISDLSKYTKAKDGHLYHPFKVYSLGNGEAEKIIDTPYTKKEVIPCQKCIGCRLENSRSWANRGFLEGKLWEQNWFVTLTYDENSIIIPFEVQDKFGFTYTETEENVWGGTLIPEDLKRFMNTLRKIYHRKGHINIRFMGCGEYGGQRGRPHYHLIIFNMPIDLDDLYEPRVINKEIYYRCRVIERAWTKGISNISECTWNNIAYTARYITKKINGEGSEKEYLSKGQLTKEFFRASTNPGIGREYYNRHWKDIYKNDEIIIKNKAGIIHSKPPKYFDDLMKVEHPEEWREISLKRKIQAQWGQKVKDDTTSLTRKEQLELEERSKDESFQKLVRMMEYQMQ